MTPQDVQKGLDDHKEHDEVRFDGLRDEMAKVKQELTYFRQDQIKTSELLRIQGSKLDVILNFFTEENIGNLKTVSKWVSAAGVWKWFFLGLAGLIIVLSQGLAALKGILMFIMGQT